ncbi:response regulator [Exilibacterium tricleocarpae]|uniref:Response regulator n=1 Tax=Exilibacterium tricleocarpae TaxID=2591008 RepID=A0A545U883_9GAMM|nr:response regulator [Exilibacterium tricleocarpae]TQV85685.1 response regulator [Exilibacterium tricleocarpae]
MNTKLAEILLVEDNLADIDLTRDAFAEAKLRNNLHVVRDGEDAVDYLFKRNKFKSAVTPDIILLDLNMPKMDGREVLKIIKKDANLRRIPTIVLTSSQADTDVIESYDLYANCYIVKPIDATKFINVVQQVENFWVEVVCLPPKPV